MKRIICISCGNPIVKSAFGDPYVCRPCSVDGIENKRYAWLDKE